MKAIIFLSVFLSLGITTVAQQDSTKKEYLIKYEVLTKKGVKILVNYFDKDEKNAGATASESWTYTFTTSNKNQNIQVSTVGGKSGFSGKVWTKINVYVNGTLIKSVEERFAQLGPTVQISLHDIK